MNFCLFGANTDCAEERQRLAEAVRDLVQERQRLSEAVKQHSINHSAAPDQPEGKMIVTVRSLVG